MLTRRVLINCYVICVAGRKGLLNTGERIKERVYIQFREEEALKRTGNNRLLFSADLKTSDLAA